MKNLAKGKLLRVSGSAGHTLLVHSGDVWLTEQGCIRDITLRAGDRYRLNGGVALVEALSDAQLSVDA
jgi:hypothetical protein